LTNIQGIGQATAKKLLKEFGSAAKVRDAAEPDLAKVVGKSAASKIAAWRGDGG
jgi:excinuclease ABC subunit C